MPQFTPFRFRPSRLINSILVAGCGITVHSAEPNQGVTASCPGVKDMIRNSLCSRVVVFVLTVSVSGFVHPGASFTQEISGGASVLLASADVEAKLGKGIFGSPPNRKHVKRPPPKTVVRSSHATRPTTSTIPRTKPETEKPAEVSHRTGEST